MTESSDSTGEDDDLKRMKIEDELPLKAVGIENLREKSNHFDLPPQDYLHVWFARRPTPAARLSVLASVLPDSTSNDELLDLMQIGPKEEIDMSVSNYVKSKSLTEDNRNGSKSDHYGYKKPFKQSPSKKEINELHETLRDYWDGEVPTVLDATAGGGAIPFEAHRYDLPTKANELNPVPSLILKTLLEYAPNVGSIREEVEKWSERIDKKATEELAQYFPSDEEGREPSHTICTYTVPCSACGCDIPLTSKWWLKKDSGSTGTAVRPSVVEGQIKYELVHLPDDVSKSEFNPTNGPVSRGGDAECLKCGIVTENSDIKEQFQNGDFEYEPYAVKYDGEDESGFRAATNSDREAMERASELVESDLDMLTILSTSIPSGNKTREPLSYGMTEWRDVFSPRQLLTQYKYFQAYSEVQAEVRQSYDDEKADAILTLLSFIPSKLVEYNSRLGTWHTTHGRPSNLMGSNNLSFQRTFFENNYSVGGLSYQSVLNRVLKSYEEICEYVSDSAGDCNNGDAASLPYEDDSIQVVSIDPPYYDSIMYAELSDVFYVWLKEYLGDTFPELLQSNLSNKTDEAVANAAKFENEEDSKKELAKQDYENKMSDIFSELYRVLEPGGVMTVMFTHKEADAWDTLTMSLINAGFVVTSTHPITSEMPQRVGMQNSKSADSTLLLTGRKPKNPTPVEERDPSLWSEVESEFQRVAREKAEDLMESELSLTKTDIIIGAFGPTLRTFTEKYPVVDDQDEPVSPERAMNEARKTVSKTISERYLDVADEFEELRGLTKWYILSWLVYEQDTIPYDEGRQLGVGVGEYIDDIKRSTKIWRTKSGDIQLQASEKRVQNIAKVEDGGQSVSSRKFPVDPTIDSFDYTIDAVHASLQVYDVKGSQFTENWLRERNFGTDEEFKTTLQALLQVLPNDHPDAEIGKNLVAGKTGELLDIETSGLFTDSDEYQSKIDDEFQQGDENDSKDD